jgi:serine/threonine protein kinase
VAYEMLSGLPPYYSVAHDVDLAIKICSGLRPKFQIKIPQLLEDLIKRCWDANSTKRPTANELEKNLRSWKQEVNSHYRDTEFKKQLREAEEFNKTLSDDVKFPKYEIHSGASYHSKLLPTKEITQLLDSGLLDLTIATRQLTIQDEQAETSLQAQIQIPPK